MKDEIGNCFGGKFLEESCDEKPAQKLKIVVGLKPVLFIRDLHGLDSFGGGWIKFYDEKIRKISCFMKFNSEEEEIKCLKPIIFFLFLVVRT